MPAQKRSSNLQQGDEEESLTHSHRRKISRRGGGGVTADHSTNSRRPAVLQSPLQQQENYSNEEQETEDQPFLCDRESDEKNPQEDSDGSGTDPEDFDEVVTILRSELRNNVQCPICLGIIRKTRTVMGCLHRFCQECIDKSMRLGNNECPACRMHCASRRSLRDDVAYDRLIDAIYPDAEKYEEEELLFGEEDKTRKEQIQASISRVSRHQLEASNRRRRFGKDADGDISPVRAPRSCRNTYSRRRKNVQRIDVEGIEDNGIENDGDGNELPKNKDDGAETKQKRRRKRVNGGSYGSSLMEETSEEKSTPPPPHVPVCNAEMFTWGRGGARSNPRNGSASNARDRVISGSRISRLIDHLGSVISGSRISRLIDHLGSVSKPKTEPAVHFELVSFENEKTPNLGKIFVSCQPNLTINQLREHVAREIRSLAEDIEMLLVKNTGRASVKTSVNSLDQRDVPTCLFPDASLLQILQGEETLARISCSSLDQHLIIAYRLKKDSSPIHLSPARGSRDAS